MPSPLSLALTLALVLFFDGGDTFVVHSDGVGDLVDDGSGQTLAPGWLWSPIISLPSSLSNLAVEVGSDSIWYPGISSLYAATGESIGGGAGLADYGDGDHGGLKFAGFGGCGAREDRFVLDWVSEVRPDRSDLADWVVAFGHDGFVDDGAGTAGQTEGNAAGCFGSVSGGRGRELGWPEMILGGAVNGGAGVLCGRVVWAWAGFVNRFWKGP